MMKNIVPRVRFEQKRSFLTVINQGFEAYRTTFGKNPSKSIEMLLTTYVDLLFIDKFV